ncbi:hypothetical protein [Halalkalibacter sp. APA_J-10(15)]|uniref:hypothetical protein n=1 Tax=Halalkalibacter sp. APA_J-10(15) TaxID=2933805 RepID=UPI001FF572A5|nr:hypothetical protein [Halalkalibacter sp. APA_J-10(15)]
MIVASIVDYVVTFFRGEPLSFDFFFSEFVIIIYMFTLPIYLLLGIPFSMLMDKLNPNWKIIYYAIAGVIAGVIINILSNQSIPNLQFDIQTVYPFMIAGIAFYIADIIIKNIVQRLIDGKFSLN